MDLRNIKPQYGLIAVDTSQIEKNENGNNIHFHCLLLFREYPTDEIREIELERIKQEIEYLPEDIVLIDAPLDIVKQLCNSIITED